MRNKKYLYIYLHIPKCAGSTFKHHLRNNFKKEEILEIGEDFVSSNYRNKAFPLFSENEKKENNEFTRNKIKEHLVNLSLEQKNKIKVIYGHYTPYGVHEYFDKNYRYITFFRNPTDMITSAYNYLLTKYENNILEEKYKSIIAPNKELISFEHFFKLIIQFSQPNPLQKYLYNLGYFEEKNILNVNELKKCLKNFYFVGITENYNPDAKFLYYKMGMTKLFKSQNISTKYYSPDKNEYKKIDNILRKKYSTDYLIYNEAIKFNKSFKKTHPEFFIIVLYMRMKNINVSKFLLKIRKIDPLLFLYKLSAIFKRHSETYTKFVKFIKNI